MQHTLSINSISKVTASIGRSALAWWGHRQGAWGGMPWSLSLGCPVGVKGPGGSPAAGLSTVLSLKVI